MKRSLRTFIFVTATACAVFGQNPGVPRFERDQCAVDVPKGERVDCGYLVVLENRSSTSKRTIRLPIAILKSGSPTPKPDPVLRTLGGPGVSSLRMVSGRRASPWLADRDMIIFEQRGTKYAQPNLSCPEVDDENINSAIAKAGFQEKTRREVDAAKSCYKRLIRSGIDLNSYNSADSAADIEDLRRVLKLDKINLYGVSYSARLMLEVMRFFPAGIRSVVLESTLPPEINYDEAGVDGIVRSLDLMFAACRNDPDCSRSYVDLENEFYAVVKRLNGQPIIVSRKHSETNRSFDVQLTGDDFVTWVVDYLFSNEPAATADAPYVIHQAFAGNYVEQFKRDGGPSLSRSPNSLAMRYSVWCSEELPFESLSKIKAQSTKYANLKGYEVMSLPDICSVWKVKAAKSTANLPVESSIPTLVIGAQYDAYTDPQWGRAVARRLKNGFFFEIPWAGHGPAFSVPCVGSMIASFIEQPGVKPSDDCLAKTKSKFRFTVPKP